MIKQIGKELMIKMALVVTWPMKQAGIFWRNIEIFISKDHKLR